MVPVQSSNIASIGHDEAAAELHVQFHNGGLFVYRGVGQDVFGRFLTAESKGQFFHQNVKEAFPCDATRVATVNPATLLHLDVICGVCGGEMGHNKMSTTQPAQVWCNDNKCRQYGKRFKAPATATELEEIK